MRVKTDTAITGDVGVISFPTGTTTATTVTEHDGQVDISVNVTAVDTSVVTAVPESTTARTLALTDAGKVVECSNSGGCTVTVPAFATVAFPLGTLVEVFQAGTGAVTIAAAGGVTINSPSSALKSFGQFSTLILRKTATNEWSLSGDLAIPTQYQTIIHRGGTFINGGIAPSQIYLGPNGSRTSGSTSAADVIFAIDPALYSVGNLTLYGRLQVGYAVNATAETGVTFTPGLYSAGAFTGAVSATITMANGSLVTGSTASLVAPAASASGVVASSDFALPAQGVYYIGVVISGASTPANASIDLNAVLYWRGA